MRLTLLTAHPRRALLTLALALLTAGGVYAQNERVNISSPTLPGAAILDQIERQTPYRFAYDRTVYDGAQTVRLGVTQTTVKGILDQMFRDQDVSYSVRGTVIALTPKNMGAAGQRQNQSPAALPAHQGVQYLTNVPGMDSPAPVPRPRRVQVIPDSVTVERVIPREFPASYSAYTRADAYTQAYQSHPAFALKTNLLYAGAALTPNLGIEFGVGQRSTIALNGSYTWYGREKDKVEDYKQFVHMTIVPEYRYWFCERFNGHFLGGHLLYGKYNISGYDVPLLFDKENRYDGDAYGAGISYGYHWALGKRWGLEFTAGVGYMHLKYDRFDCRTCDRNGIAETKNYFGPTRLGINLVFLIK